MAPIFISFNIPCTHTLRVILVIVSGEQVYWPYTRPQLIFLCKMLWVGHKIIHQGSTDYSVKVRLCVLKHLWSNYSSPIFVGVDIPIIVVIEVFPDSMKVLVVDILTT